MDRNAILGLLLILTILIGYSIWMTPSQEEREVMRMKQDSIEELKRVADSTQAVARMAKAVEDSIRALVRSETADSAKTSPPDRDKLGSFANSSTGTEEIIYLENNRMKVGISSRGGKIVSVQLKEFVTWDSLPLILFDPQKTEFGLIFFSRNRNIQTNNHFFQPVWNGSAGNEGTDTAAEGVPASLSMRLYPDASDTSLARNRYLEYLYTLPHDSYMLDFRIHFVGLEEMIDPTGNYLDLFWKTDLLMQERTVDRMNGPTIYYKYYQDEVDYLSEAKDDEESLKTKIQWISYKQRFFTSTLIAEEPFLNAEIKSYTLENQGPRYLKTMESVIAFPFENSDGFSVPCNFYFGPNKFRILKKFDLDLERQIPIGWSFFLMAWINRYIVIPVFNFLEGFGLNYGIIILILTILLKIVLFPIAYKSYVSSAKMRVLKPEIDEIGQKFPKKEDAMKKQQAVMALYKQAGVNPMAGCVPLLLQFPILIAMFRFFPSSFELRQQPFLWAHDLSSYDSILELPFNIPFYGDHVSLFTLLMTVSTIIYTKINNDLMGSSSQQLPGMKTMMYLMPIMFLGWFNNYAAGLSYYYMLANLITFGQMFVIRRTIDEGKIRSKIEENKKKPVRKSNWQKRLEDAARKRGYKPVRK
ncbi:MAG: membrane protein insertase YidC [Bacteroidales bacterium]|nr:membrane protein insertase YidC [Bacteroidales bacterium]